MSHCALQILPPLSSDPMGLRIRRSARLGPLRFNNRCAGLRLRQGRPQLDLLG